MASIKLYVGLTLFVLTSSRPTENELPHSRDFYAGYIKALNDNFDALFKPGRKTRSIAESEEEGGDAAQESRTKVLHELIDKNPQKRDDAVGIEVYKRYLLGEDIMNTNTELGEAAKAEANQTGHAGIAAVNDQPVEARGKSSGINANITTHKDTNITGKIEVPEVGEGINPADDASAEKDTNATKGDNVNGENDTGGDVTSGNKKSIENNSDDAASGGSEINSDDMTSGDNDTNEETSSDVASGSKLTSVNMDTGDVKGENSFEGRTEKREIRNVDDENNFASGNDDDGSSDRDTNNEATKTKTDARDDVIEKETENRKPKTENGESKNVEDNAIIANNTAMEKPKNESKNENNNNITKQPEKTKNKIHDEKKRTVADDDRKIEDTQMATIEGKKDEDESETEDNLNVKEGKKTVDDDGSDNNKAADNNAVETKSTTRRNAHPDVKMQNGKSNTNNTKKRAHKKRRKVAAKGKHHHKYTPEKSRAGSSAKRYEEDFMLPDDFSSENDDNDDTDDKALLDAPEPSYASRIPGIETSTIEHFSNDKVDPVQDRELSERISYQPVMYYSRGPYAGNTGNTGRDYSGRDYENNLKRHFILEHSSMQHIPYMPGIMSGFTEDQYERNNMPPERYTMSPTESNMIGPGNNMVPSGNNMVPSGNNMAPPENNMVPSTGHMRRQENSVINERYSSGLPPSNQEVGGVHQSPYYNDYQQQTPYNAPMEQIQYVDKYAHGMDDGRTENNNQGYVPQRATEAAASTRSIVISAIHGKHHRHHHHHHHHHHHDKHDSSVIKVPSTIVDRFIQNAGQIYQFGEELARNSPAFLENDETGITRDSVSSRESYHEPVLLQPIIVLMPYGRSN